MTPTLFFFAVQSAIRLGQAGKQAYRENLRAKPYKVVLPQGGIVSMETEALRELMVNGEMLFADEGAPLFGIFVQDGGSWAIARNVDVELRRRAVAEGYRLYAEKNPQLAPPDAPPPPEGVQPAGIVVLQAWAQGQAPSPWARLGLTMADIAVGFVAQSPNTFGMRGKAEVMVGALARHLEVLIPDTGQPSDPSISFRERAIAVFMEAGLQTLSENADQIAEPHIAELARGMLQPLVGAFDQAREVRGGAALPELANVRDTLLGPMAQSALRAVAANQEAFLGRKFSGETGLGAVTQSVLGAAIGIDQESFSLRKAFTREGLTMVYSSALGAVAQQPELFIQGRSANTGLGRELLRGVASTLQSSPPPFDDLGPQLAAMTFEVAASYAPNMFDQDNPWERASANAVSGVLQGFATGIRSGGGDNPFKTLFSRDQALGVARSFLEEAARTPQMLTGDKASPELQAIASAMAFTLADPNRNLLSGEDWRVVVATGLSEAAKNPAALFHIEKADQPAEQLGVQMLTNLLDVAGSTMREANGRQLGVVLFGETLRDAMTATLRAGANNARALMAPEGVEAAAKLAARLNQQSLESGGAMGQAEWLWLFRRYVAHAIATGQPPDITNKRLSELLAEADVKVGPS